MGTNVLKNPTATYYDKEYMRIVQPPLCITRGGYLSETELIDESFGNKLTPIESGIASYFGIYPPRVSLGVYPVRQTGGGGSMAGNGDRGRGKGFVRRTRAG